MNSTGAPSASPSAPPRSMARVRDRKTGESLAGRNGVSAGGSLDGIEPSRVEVPMMNGGRSRSRDTVIVVALIVPIEGVVVGLAVLGIILIARVPRVDLGHRVLGCATAVDDLHQGRIPQLVHVERDGDDQVHRLDAERPALDIHRNLLAS